MDFKTFLHAGSNRRAMLKGMGVAAVGFSLTGALAGCGEKEAAKLANGEEAKLNVALQQSPGRLYQLLMPGLGSRWACRDDATHQHCHSVFEGWC